MHLLPDTHMHTQPYRYFCIHPLWPLCDHLQNNNHWHTETLSDWKNQVRYALTHTQTYRQGKHIQMYVCKHFVYKDMSHIITNSTKLSAFSAHTNAYTQVLFALAWFGLVVYKKQAKKMTFLFPFNLISWIKYREILLIIVDAHQLYSCNLLPTLTAVCVSYWLNVTSWVGKDSK